MIKEKMDSDPSFNPKSVFLDQYDAAERLIIEKSAVVRGQYLDVWKPASGCVK